MNALALNRRNDRILMPGPSPVIQTGRLTLRPHRLSDADAIVMAELTRRSGQRAS